MDSEEQNRLWRREALRGDRAAASLLLHGQYSRIYAYLRRLAGNDADAADLTQETFRKVWKSLERYREDSSISTWMHRIAYCTWVDWLRQHRAAASQSEHWWRELPGDFPSPLQTTATEERLRLLWQQVDQLPEEERQIIHLHFGQQLTQAETAEVIGLPLSTLKLRLRSALDRLRLRLKEFNGDFANTNP
ncbi:MAG: RNA polymerase sigma factor [Verrucomicrobiae bacterium]|nr:RNA polymerase sigma factor [Verrucomicrobiae bacterium]